MGEQRTFIARTVVAFAVVAVLFCLLIARMVWLMVVEYDVHLTASNDNRSQLLPLAAQRGLIYDRSGKLLADNQPAFAISITPEYVDDLAGTLAEVGRLVDLSDDDVEAFYERMRDRNRRPMTPVALKRNIDTRERALIEVDRHRLRGVYVVAEPVRHYPFGALLSHAVGSMRRISEEDLKRLDERLYRAARFVGKRGVEGFYERSLYGEPGYRVVEVDARGQAFEDLFRRDAVPGKNITLHLDVDLQHAASEALGDRRGAVVAIEPSTGGILALLSKPGYDPNLFVNGIAPAQYRILAESRDTPLLNRATQGVYAPGSTFKPVVGLAALAAGVTDWERTMLDNGEFRLPGVKRPWRDWSWREGNSGGQGIVDLHRAVYRSSNTYFYDLGSKLGAGDLSAFAAQFGYGRVTAIDVARAAEGVMPDPEWKAEARGEVWVPGDSINLSIGQGDLLATPLQLATVASVIANRGRLVAPRMLKASDELLEEFTPVESVRVQGLESEDWERMVDAMEAVVHRGDFGYRQNGTAWFYIGQDIAYRMAGKSGTAQLVAIPDGEEYDEALLDEYERKHAWFIAFAPADDPEIAVCVLVENGGGGSSVAAPVAKAVIDAHLLPGQEKAPLVAQL